jgi:hypothetical protein
MLPSPGPWDIQATTEYYRDSSSRASESESSATVRRRGLLFLTQKIRCNRHGMVSESMAGPGSDLRLRVSLRLDESWSDSPDPCQCRYGGPAAAAAARVMPVSD